MHANSQVSLGFEKKMIKMFEMQALQLIKLFVSLLFMETNINKKM